MGKNKKTLKTDFLILLVVALIFILVLPGLASQSQLGTTGAIFTSTTETPRRGFVAVSSNYMQVNRIAYFDNVNDRVLVNARGFNSSVYYAVSDNAQISYTNFYYTIFSFPALKGGSDARTSDNTHLHLFSAKYAGHNIKLVPGKYKFALEYKYLTGEGFYSTHFINLLTGTSLGTVNAHLGLSSYFGGAPDTELGVFINFIHDFKGKMETTLEYNSRDTFKLIQNGYFARTNSIGEIDMSNAPKDALSLGFRLTDKNDIGLNFNLYDFLQSQSWTVGIGFPY